MRYEGKYQRGDERERAADFLMRELNRRTVFRGIGVAGATITSFLLSRGLVGDAGRALSSPLFPAGLIA